MEILKEIMRKGRCAFVTNVKHINDGKRANVLSDNGNETQFSRLPVKPLFHISLWQFYFHN